MILEAECAWWVDPVFDLAFCLNDVLLKCLWTPHAATEFMACFDAMAQAYLGLSTGRRHRPSRRAASLPPSLFLCRVDG